MDRQRVAGELLKLAKDLTSFSEGDWSKEFIRDSGGILGLDSSRHTNEGWRLVRLPARIYSSIVALGLQNKIEQVMLSGDSWRIQLPLQVHVPTGDFRKLISSGMNSFRADKDGVNLFFNS